MSDSMEYHLVRKKDETIKEFALRVKNTYVKVEKSQTDKNKNLKCLLSSKTKPKE